jgi:hypothetical protein
LLLESLSQDLLSTQILAQEKILSFGSARSIYLPINSLYSEGHHHSNNEEEDMQSQTHIETTEGTSFSGTKIRGPFIQIHPSCSQKIWTTCGISDPYLPCAQRERKKTLCPNSQKKWLREPLLMRGFHRSLGRL